MKKRFLYNAEAVGASGHITLPFTETIPIQAGIALPLTGGHGSHVVEDFRYRDIVSIHRIETRVVGSYSTKDQAHGTVAMSTLEGLNVMDMVTCDRVVSRITTKHPDSGAEASILPLGSEFENLRIAGISVSPELAVDLFCEHDTLEKLNRSYSGEEKFRGELNKLLMVPATGNTIPLSRSGTVGCSLIRDFGKLGGGLVFQDGGIWVPQFGMVYLGEMFISSGLRKLSMLRIELGCAVEGCFSGSGSTGNSSGYP